MKINITRAGARSRLVATALVAVCSVAAHAQFRTSIQGTVTDPTGAVVPGATLTLRDNATNATIVHTSDQSGVYNFNALGDDRFTLTVTHAGFQNKVLTSLQLIPEQPNAVNVQLDLAGTNQEVTVDASTASALDTETASLSATVNSNQIQHLPTQGRDVFQLVQLAPGAVSDGAQASGGGTYNLPGTQTGGGGSGAGDGIFKTENGPPANANGGQFETNGISIDGISTVSAVWGGSSVITPSEDSVSNIKVVTNDYDAENGRFSGAQIQVTSKSGTNQFHGSAFFRINRPGLNAYQRYNGPNSLQPGSALARGLQRDTQRFNQMGGSLGGPIWKDKVFAFFAYETIRNNSTATATGWYDTPQFDALAPTGSIAAQFLTFPGATVSGTMVNSTCATAGLVEGSTCHAVAGGLNIGTPLTSARGTQDQTFVQGDPTHPGVGSGLGTTPDIALYNTQSPVTSVQQQFNGRLDADATKKDHLAFAIYWVPVSTTSLNGGARPYNLFNHNQINDAFSVIWNHTFSPTLLNEARANAAGWRWNEVTDNPQSPVGLPASTVSQIGSINPNLNQFGSALGSHLNQWTYTYKDVATKVFGRHTLKFGGEGTRLYYLNDQTYAERPSFGFFNIWDFLNDAPKEESGSFNPATGLPGPSREDDRQNFWALFVQDAYKIRPNFTLNYGIRYSHFGPLYAKQNNFGVVLFGQGSAALTGVDVRPGGPLWSPQKGNFGPQLGFAWSPGSFRDKLVLRGGYGLNFNQEEIALTSNVGNNPPGQTYYDFNSNSPTAINSNIVYAISSDPHSLSGYPANPHTVTTFNGAGLQTAGSVSLTAFPYNNPTAYAHHYSLDTEYQLPYNVVASAGYEGSSSRHLVRQYNVNAVASQHGVALNPLVSSFSEFGSDGGSNNNALLVGLTHSMAHHFMVDAHFTYAKSMDDNSGPYSEDPYYPLSPRYAYGRSDFNVGKLLKIYGLWQPVFFHGSHGWVEKIAGEWSLSGIYNLHSGFPWTPVYNTAQLYCFNCSYGQLRPQYLGGSRRSTGNKAFESAANTAASNFPNIGTPTNPGNGTGYVNGYFAVPNYSAGLAGNSFPGVSAGAPPPPGIARNSFTGPGYQDLDASLTKGFGLPKMRVLGEDARFEIRGDIFNLFNETNLNVSSITGDITSPEFGRAQNALGSRTINFQARFSF